MRCLGGFFLCFLVSSALLANEVCTRIPGSTICTAGELDVLTETGIVHIHSTKIKHCHITGELLVKHAEIDVLEVIGKANVISSNINTGKVLGLLSLERSKVGGEINVVANKMSVDNSELHSILMQGDDFPILQLSGNSIVNGNIEFLGKTGVVEKDGLATINGKIINGKLQERGTGS